MFQQLSVAVLISASLTTASAAQDPVPTCRVRGSHQWLSQRASPLDSTVVSLDAGTAKVCYSRPSARGRQVFGGMVEYGKLWRTGANEPTLLYLPFAADLGGVQLQPGRYMLFTVPQADSWVVAFYVSDAMEAADMFQSMRPVGQGTATAEALPALVETFTIRGVSGATEGDLLLEWERVRVRIPIRSLPNPRLDLSGAQEASARGSAVADPRLRK